MKEYYAALKITPLKLFCKKGQSEQSCGKRTQREVFPLLLKLHERITYSSSSSVPKYLLSAFFH